MRVSTASMALALGGLPLALSGFWVVLDWLIWFALAIALAAVVMGCIGLVTPKGRGRAITGIIAGVIAGYLALFWILMADVSFIKDIG
jgi:hypothetical protein